MPAHLRPITFRCEYHFCTSRAVVQLYTTRNEPCGRYCRRHGNLKLAEQLKHDAREERVE